MRIKELKEENERHHRIAEKFIELNRKSKEQLAKAEEVLKMYADENLVMVDLKAAENEIFRLLDKHRPITKRDKYPSTENINRREAIMEFVRITKKFIVCNAQEYFKDKED